MRYANKFPVSKAGENSCKVSTNKVDLQPLGVPVAYASELKSLCNTVNARFSMLENKLDIALEALNCNTESIKIYIARKEEARFVLNCNDSLLKYYRTNNLIDWYSTFGVKYYDLCSIRKLVIPEQPEIDMLSKIPTITPQHISAESRGKSTLGHGIIKLIQSLHTKFYHHINSVK